MDFQKLFNIIETADPEVFERMDSRRSAMKEFAGMASKVALASVPLVFGSMFKKAYAQSTSTRSAFDVLNFALTLEHLEATFYTMGIGSSAVMAGMEYSALVDIQKDETAHVNFLTAAITAAGGTPVGAAMQYDFTAGGNFSDVFTNYSTFLAVAQAFEDTGVRAYKGQAGYLLGTPYLTPALNIHSVEARHASFIRQTRRNYGVAIKPWVTLDGITASGISAATNASYAGEANTTIAGVQIVGIAGHTEIDANTASECFDEILTTDQVLAIAGLFIKQA